ncbi:hypothetical protein COS75_02250 [Candidatus Pacearchaeota archaeon CG06_land_8_20_14_3_00_35_12]|nr:MAG: hypothetical protein COS75_02250 [Candidatus Pacearchaeota archaeon CG06_land_8_20_14_3_00_35_12]
MPRQKSRRKASSRTARRARTTSDDSLDRTLDRASEKFQMAERELTEKKLGPKFEPIMPRIAGRLPPAMAKDDKFEKFARAVQKIRTITRAKLVERKKTSLVKWLIALIIILLGINLVWILIRIL